MLEDDYVAVGAAGRTSSRATKNSGLRSACPPSCSTRRIGRTPSTSSGRCTSSKGSAPTKRRHWVEQLRDQLELDEGQVRFITYHGGADEEHTEKMFEILRSDLITPEIAQRIVHTARVVGRLYALQLEEIENA